MKSGDFSDLSWHWVPSWISTNCLTDSSQINQINQLKILNGLPSILSVTESHRANIMFTQAILIGSSRGVNLSPDPFLVGCMAAFFKRSPWPHSNVSRASLFIFTSSTSSSRVLLIFAAGTTLSLRDSTRTGFRMDSSVISTLLEISSFLDASTGIRKY